MSQKIPFFLICMVIPGLFACSKTGEQEALTQQVDKLVNAIEAHDKQKINECLSKDFSAGNELNKARFDVFLRYHLGRNKNISILRSNEKIEIKNSVADITADVFLLGASDWIPERGQKYMIESRWVKENDLWVMSRLRWQLKERTQY